SRGRAGGHAWAPRGGSRPLHHPHRRRRGDGAGGGGPAHRGLGLTAVGVFMAHTAINSPVVAGSPRRLPYLTCSEVPVAPIRRSIQLAPTVSVRPWATIEARMTKAAVSKIVDAAPTSDCSTNRA